MVTSALPELQDLVLPLIEEALVGLRADAAREIVPILKRATG